MAQNSTDRKKRGGGRRKKSPASRLCGKLLYRVLALVFRAQSPRALEKYFAMTEESFNAAEWNSTGAFLRFKEGSIPNSKSKITKMILKHFPGWALLRNLLFWKMIDNPTSKKVTQLLKELSERMPEIGLILPDGELDPRVTRRQMKRVWKFLDQKGDIDALTVYIGLCWKYIDKGWLMDYYETGRRAYFLFMRVAISVPFYEIAYELSDHLLGTIFASGKFGNNVLEKSTINGVEHHAFDLNHFLRQIDLGIQLWMRGIVFEALEGMGWPQSDPQVQRASFYLADEYGVAEVCIEMNDAYFSGDWTGARDTAFAKWYAKKIKQIPLMESAVDSIL